jgi:hypothetical protein
MYSNDSQVVFKVRPKRYLVPVSPLLCGVWMTLLLGLCAPFDVERKIFFPDQYIIKTMIALPPVEDMRKMGVTVWEHIQIEKSKVNNKLPALEVCVNLSPDSRFGSGWGRGLRGRTTLNLTEKSLLGFYGKLLGLSTIYETHHDRTGI